MDSGSSVHLVNDMNMLREAANRDKVCRAANGGEVRVTKIGTVKFRTVVDGKEAAVDLSEVYYADNLMDNMINYGRFEGRGVYLERHNGKSYAVREEDQMHVFEVHRRNDVRMVDVMCAQTKDTRVHVVNAAVHEAGKALGDAVTETTLLALHKRLGHITYDTANAWQM
ncbi:hypothetical protein PI124_g8483 [Phytophthora idaei]|nr:hypothetical protein PI125_g8863 [Phytophthora idaei]KAG3151446.1 hypothetical protein PI126_g10999 [Phytophthora idaei]KAG3246820.1 hypothetical protein PI124_g8483 [Phytophthora idaei]